MEEVTPLKNNSNNNQEMQSGFFIHQFSSHSTRQHNLPLEVAHFINTKQLKFIVARSKWQVSWP